MNTQLVVPRGDLAAITPRETDSPTLEPGQSRLTIDRFGLSSNNITYGLFGDAMGYWAYFPVDDDHGCLPVWGFADVTESTHPEVPVGARLFGLLPFATELILQPGPVDELTLTDAMPHRAGLHPWYNRYHRCDADPVWTQDGESLQASLWPLFMTGWALADELAAGSNGNVTSVVVSSASSKTALALAWSLRHLHEGVQVVGLTSSSNLDAVRELGVYDHVTDYDQLDLAGVAGPSAFVDAAGNGLVRERTHVELGDRLVDSVMLGATHQGAGTASSEPVGPTPRLFFIPDVAEVTAADTGHRAYHQSFAEAWHSFADWIGARLHIHTGSGRTDIVDAYRDLLAGAVEPNTARVLTW